MRVLIDTNILISCIVWPDTKPAQAFFKAAYAYPNKAVICEYSIEELYKVFRRKFPGYVLKMSDFLAKHFPVLEIVPVPAVSFETEQLIRDDKDRPILRAAIMAEVDILLTGDKDFLEAGITTPTIMSPSEFLEMKGVSQS